MASYKELLNLKSASEEIEKEILINEELDNLYDFLSDKSDCYIASFLLSLKNWLNSQMNEKNIIDCQCGDIVRIDYGNSYENECYFQHLGLVLAKCNNKIFVVPMTGSVETYNNALIGNTDYLIPMPLIEGTWDYHNKKPSTLFLNDSKWISQDRVIAFVTHIDCNNEYYMIIKNKVFDFLQRKSTGLDKVI